MEDYIKVSAKRVSDALMEAAIQLETSSDNIEYEVLEQGSTGFLGFGSKPAVIKARKKADFSMDLVKEEPVIETPKVSEAPVAKKEKAKVVKDQTEEKPAREPKTPFNKEEAVQAAKEFLTETFKAMGMTVDVKAEFDKDDNLNIDLSGEEMGILIGKRGQTLDSIQYLTSLVVNKGNASYVRVKVDTENYRSRRKETLENLAKNIAIKVKRTKKPVFLEPMNPYERRIIHSALQNDAYVSTHSEGEEPYRKVVVTLKK